MERYLKTEILPLTADVLNDGVLLETYSTQDIKGVKNLKPQKDFGIKTNFTRFWNNYVHSNEPFVPKSQMEMEVMTIIKNYRYEDYVKNRQKLRSRGTNLSPYMALGVVTTDQVMGLVKDPECQRQLAWATYSRSYAPPKQNLSVLTPDQEAHYFKWCQGRLPNPKLNYWINEMKKGHCSNRIRLILSYYLIKELKIYWGYGELYFRSVLIDYHPEVNRYNWLAQSKNRFLSRYNIDRQLEIYL